MTDKKPLDLAEIKHANDLDLKMNLSSNVTIPGGYFRAKCEQIDTLVNALRDFDARVIQFSGKEHPYTVHGITDTAERRSEHMPGVRF